MKSRTRPTMGSRLGAASSVALALTLSACAGTRTNLTRQPDSYGLGRNAAGEPCTATRNWRDTAVGSVWDESWSIGCRNVTASRSLGLLRVLRDDDGRDEIEKTLTCGETRQVSVPDVGDVQARRCYDTLLAAPTIAFTTQVDGRTISFRVAARDEREPIGGGTHQRVVVSVARFDERVQRKLRGG